MKDINSISEKGFTILIIDDSPTLRGEVIGILKSTRLFSEFLEAENPTAGLKHLVNNKIDIVLCDLVMPGMDGFKFLAMKLSSPEFTEIPVIMLTSKGELRDKIKGLEDGASDYLTKPFNPGELIARVKAHLRIKVLQDALKKTNEKLIQLSITDVLTGLFNRRHFMELLDKEFERVQRYGAKLSFLMIDVDLFKRINDTYGHLAGDSVLKEIGGLLSLGLRKHIDVLGRYGGEEFAMLLPETNMDGAKTLAERYRIMVEKASFRIPGGTTKMTISIGCSSAPDPSIQTVEQFIQFADEALYRAKKSGRNKAEAMMPTQPPPEKKLPRGLKK